MPKTSQEQIDNDEKKVIKEISNNAKESIDNIAKKCGFSRQKVWRIIKRLEKDNTIWGYNAVVDDKKVNMKKYFLLMKRKNVSIKKEDLDIIVNREIRNESSEFKVDPIGSYFVNGTFEWVVILTAPSILYVKKYVEMFLTTFKDYILDIQILEVIFPIQENGFNNPNIKEFLDYF